MKACLSFAAVPAHLTRLVLLFGVGAQPPHDGIRRMGRVNLRSDLNRERLESSECAILTPSIVPVRDVVPQLTRKLFNPPYRPLSPLGYPELEHQAATGSLPHRNSVPSTHIRCRMTPSRRATATIAFSMPRR